MQDDKRLSFSLEFLSAPKVIPNYEDYMTGDWIAQDPAVKPNCYSDLASVYRYPNSRCPDIIHIASTTPILIRNRFSNVQTGYEFVEICWGRYLSSSIIVPRKTISSPNNIISLSQYGIPVTTDNAKFLMSYFASCIDWNSDGILRPKRSTSKMGWQKGKDSAFLESSKGDFKPAFAPYFGDLTIDRDTDPGSTSTLKAICIQGTFRKWQEYTGNLRKSSAVVRIVLAASLASALLDPCDALPFILHIWGRSGYGKSVLLSIAASVWGAPGLVFSMNSTLQALYNRADTLNSIPLFCDELQTVKEYHSGGYDSIIMNVCEGKGRSRLNSDGTAQIAGTWNNATIFTGEEPILGNNSGNGAINRVIQLELDSPVFNGTDGGKAKRITSENFGHAGRKFVEYVRDAGFEWCFSAMQAIHEDVMRETNATEKQALIASMLVLADKIARECIWTSDDAAELTISDLAPFLATDETVDKPGEAFEAVRGIISNNSQSFIDIHNTAQSNSKIIGKLRGYRDGDETVITQACIEVGFLRDELAKRGYVLAACDKEWAKRGLIETTTEKRGGKTVTRMTQSTKVNKISTRCYVFNLPQDSGL